MPHSVRLSHVPLPRSRPPPFLSLFSLAHSPAAACAHAVSLQVPDGVVARGAGGRCGADLPPGNVCAAAPVKQASGPCTIPLSHPFLLLTLPPRVPRPHPSSTPSHCLPQWPGERRPRRRLPRGQGQLPQGRRPGRAGARRSPAPCSPPRSLLRCAAGPGARCPSALPLCAAPLRCPSALPLCAAPLRCGAR